MCVCVFFSAIVHIHVPMMFGAVDDFVYLVAITSAGNLIPEVAVETGDSKKKLPNHFVHMYTCTSSDNKQHRRFLMMECR